MKVRVLSVLAIAMALLICPPSAWADDEAQTPEITVGASKAAMCTPVSRDVLVASGVIPDDIDPVVPCLMTVEGEMAFTTIAQGKWSAFGWCSDNSPNMDPCLCAGPPVWVCVWPNEPHFEAVIRDECVWADFWAAHQFGPFGTPPPAVDFDNYVVIAAVLGMRDNCGYEVEISSIRQTECGVQVTVVECLQLYCQAREVNPFHFVKIPKTCVPYTTRVCFYHGG